MAAETRTSSVQRSNNHDLLSTIFLNLIEKYSLISKKLDLINDEKLKNIIKIQELESNSPTTMRRKLEIIPTKKLLSYEIAYRSKIQEIQVFIDTLNFDDTNIDCLIDKSFFKNHKYESTKEYIQRLKFLQIVVVQLTFSLHDFFKSISKKFDVITDFYFRNTSSTKSEKALSLQSLLSNFLDFFDEIESHIDTLITNAEKTPNGEINSIKNQGITKLKQQFNQNDINFLINIYNANHSEKINTFESTNTSLNALKFEELKLVKEFIISTEIEKIVVPNKEDINRLALLKNALNISFLSERILGNLNTPSDISTVIIELKSVICNLRELHQKEKTPALKQLYQSNEIILREAYGKINQLLYLDDTYCTDNKFFSNLSVSAPSNIGFKINSAEDLFMMTFFPDPIILSQKRPAFFDWKNQNIYDENKTIDNLSKIVMDNNNTKNYTDFSKIDKIISENKPAFWKWWRNEEHHRYIDIEYNAKLFLVLQAFKEGQMDEISLVAIIQLLANNHPHAQRGKLFNQIADNIISHYEKNARLYINQTQSVSDEKNNHQSLAQKKACLYNQIYTRLNNTHLKNHPLLTDEIPSSKNGDVITDVCVESFGLPIKEWICNAIEKEENKLLETRIFKK
jgi:hypothetical protein